MSSNFFVILPSSTPYKGDVSGINKPNKFKIQLPRTLIFDGTWMAGLHSIVYPRTWPIVGAMGRQYLILKYKDGRKFVVPVPTGNPATEEELEHFLNTSIVPETLSKLTLRMSKTRQKRAATQPVQEGDPKRSPSATVPSQTQAPPQSQSQTNQDSHSSNEETAMQTQQTPTQTTTQQGTQKPTTHQVTQTAALTQQRPESGAEVTVKSQTSPPTPPKITLHELKVEKKRRLIFLEGEAQKLIKELAEKTLTIYDEVDLDKRERMIGLRGTESANIINLYVEALEIMHPERGTLGPADVEEYNRRQTLYMQTIQHLREAQQNLEKEIKEEIQTKQKLEETRRQQEKFKEESEKAQDKGIEEAREQESIRSQITEDKYETLQETVRLDVEEEESLLNKSIKEDGYYFPISVLDGEIEKAIKSIKFTYLKSSGKFRINFTDEKIDSVQISFVLNYTLGFQEGLFLKNGETALRMPDLRGGVDQLYVYTNVCQDMIVGDRFTNMIRNVTVSGKHGQIVEKIYDSPIFNRILQRSVDEIEVEILANDGTPIPFQTGEVTLTLYFKKVLFM